MIKSEVGNCDPLLNKDTWLYNEVVRYPTNKVVRYPANKVWWPYRPKNIKYLT